MSGGGGSGIRGCRGGDEAGWEEGERGQGNGRLRPFSSPPPQHPDHVVALSDTSGSLRALDVLLASPAPFRCGLSAADRSIHCIRRAGDGFSHATHLFPQPICPCLGASMPSDASMYILCWNL